MVQVLVWPTGSVVRVPQYEHLHKDSCAGPHTDTSTVPVVPPVLYAERGELCACPHKDTSTVPILYRESSDLLPALRRFEFAQVSFVK